MGALAIPLGIFCLPFILISSMASFFVSLRALIKRQEASYLHDLAMGTGFVASLPFVFSASAMVFGLLGLTNHH